MSLSVSQERIAEWRFNPIKFTTDVFGITPDEWQLDLLRSIGGPTNPRRRVAMKACTGPGKSAGLAWVGWHRLMCFASPGEHPKGAALSGEGRDNLRDNLWAELFKWRNRSPLLTELFEQNQARIYAKHHPETWFCSARSYAKNADAEAIGSALSGLHSAFPFLLLDETGNMPITVGQKAQQIFTGGVTDGLIAQAGNPTSTNGLLYQSSISEADQWIVITITADPNDPKRTPRVEIEHARDMIKRYGRENPWVMSTILGLFPPTGFNSLLGPADVEAAMNRRYKESAYLYSQKRLGVDVARYGDDASVIFPRQGIQAFAPVVMQSASNPEVGSRVIAAKLKWGSEAEFIDGTGGFGGGVVDFMRTNGYSPHEIHFSQSPIDSRYHNKRAEIWMLMADSIKKNLALPKNGKLLKELVAPQYTFTNGKFLLEPKEAIKKRLGFSPDYGDALALTFSMPEMQSDPMNAPQFQALKALHDNRSHNIGDYDPFDPKRF